MTARWELPSAQERTRSFHCALTIINLDNVAYVFALFVWTAYCRDNLVLAISR